MNNRAVSPTIAVLLLIALSVGLFSLSVTQFYNLSDNNFEYSESVAEIDGVSGKDAVETRIVQRSESEELYLRTPTSKGKLPSIGETKIAEDGTGVYSIVAENEDGQEQVIDSYTIPGPDTSVKFAMSLDSTSVNGDDIDVTMSRSSGSAEVNFRSFEITGVTTEGSNSGPATDGTSLGSHSTNGDYTSTVNFGTKYSFNSEVPYTTGSIKYTIKNLDNSPDSVSIAPSGYEDITSTIETANGQIVKIPIVFDTLVILEEQSAYEDKITSVNGLITEDNVVLENKIQDVDGEVTLGNSNTVEGKVQSIEEDFISGDSNTFNLKIKDIDGDFITGDDTTVENTIQDVDGDVILGDRNTVDGKIQNTGGNIKIGQDSEIKGKLKNNDGSVTAYSGVVFRSNVNQDVNCPDGSDTVTFEGSKGKCA